MPVHDKLKPQWFNILLALSDGERHGQGIMAEVLRQTEGSMRLWPTSLYGSLPRLSERGIIDDSLPAGAALLTFGDGVLETAVIAVEHPPEGG